MMLSHDHILMMLFHDQVACFVDLEPVWVWRNRNYIIFQILFFM